MKKVRVMVRRHINLRYRIIHEYTEIDPDIVQNEVPRLLEKSEALLKGSGYD